MKERSENQYRYERQADDADYLFLDHNFGNNCRAHFHGATEFLFVRTGRAEAIVNGVSRVLEAGELAVVPSYHVHAYRCGPENEVYVLLLSQGLLRRFLSRHDGMFDSFLPAGPRTPEIFEWLELSWTRWPEADPLMRYGLATYLLGLLAQTYPTERRLDAKEPSAARILQYIEDHATEELTLEALAARFGYSKNYFSAMFNRVTGMHLKEYVNRLRIQLALPRLALADRNETVLKIASDCGFNSLNTFYRTLRRCREKS